jgi:hypothetical protein
MSGQPGQGGTLTTSGAGALPTESDANLCEFALFGVVSLYEQVPAKEKPKDEGNKQPDPTGQPTDPVKPMDPANPMPPQEPTDKPKEPADKSTVPPGEKKEPAQTPPPK